MKSLAPARIYARPPADNIQGVVLTANTHAPVTVPTTAKFVLFSATGDFYAKFDSPDAEAQIPSSGTPGVACELNPGHWALPEAAAARQISVIAPTTGTIVTLAFYK